MENCRNAVFAFLRIYLSDDSGRVTVRVTFTRCGWKGHD